MLEPRPFSEPHLPRYFDSVSLPSEERERVRSISRPHLVHIPMLHHASAIQPEHIRDRRRSIGNAQMHEPNISIKGLVDNGPAHAWDQVLEECDGGGASLGRVGGVVDIVWGDVGQVGGGGILLDVELVDEVEEDGVLLSRGRGLGGAEWCLGCCRAVIFGGWVCKKSGECGEREGHES